MPSTLSFIHLLQEMLQNHGALVATIATFLSGENAALALFALSAQGYIHPIKALFFVFCGSMLADIFWFVVTEYVLRPYYEKKGGVSFALRPKNKTEEKVLRRIDTHFFWMLIFIKFLIGMRLVLTIYIVLKNKIPFYKKVAYDAAGTIIFLAVLFPIGFLFGKGVSSIFSYTENIMNIISLVVSIIVFMFIAKKIMVSVISY